MVLALTLVLEEPVLQQLYQELLQLTLAVVEAVQEITTML